MKTSETEKQKFHRGDLVRVAKDLGSSMSHFTSDVDAIVRGSYADQFGGDNIDSYTLYLKGRGQCSWYHEHQLTLIESGRKDLLKAWKKERKAEEKLKSNLDWIFENGPDVLKSAHGSSVQALASCLGCNNLWGSRGEGIDYLSNALIIMRIAKPFLENKDKEGWLHYCGENNKNEE